MGKHDKAKQGKNARNELYGTRYRQLICKKCGHRSCLGGRCKGCGAEAKERRPKNH